jgi:type 1 glutamine amidotransferase
MRRFWILLSVGLIGVTSPVQAKALLDCPMRDAPFSINAPLVDLLLSETAKATIEKNLPGSIAKIPPFFSGTQAPTFSSILTFKSLMGMFQGTAAPNLAKLDADLRALPVSKADKIKRCERYDDDRPKFAMPKDKLRVLLFEKMTGFRDTPSVLAAHTALKSMAERNGWAFATTDKGGAMHPSVLKQFDLVIWNNVSGDVLTLKQRTAFRRFVEGGGGFVGMHGSAGDPVYFWDWYPDTLIGARFIGHPSDPQFQDARINIEATPSGIGSTLGTGWTMNDEWYSFAKSSRSNGSAVVATLDEKSYTPGASRFGGPPLEMGSDHPIAWTRCVAKGRAFYSAIGHRPETYSDVNYVVMLTQAIKWAARKEGKGCQGTTK